VEYFEDDRDSENYRFIIVKQIIGGITLEEKVKDMTKIELACIINNYAKCIQNLNMPNFQVKPVSLTPDKIRFS